MKRLKYFALAALVAFAACDEGDEVVVPEPVTGTISGVVQIDGAAAQGVTVTLSSGATSTTDGTGSYSFTGVEAGAYTVTISGTPADAAFPTTSQAAVISTAGQVVTVNFSGSFITTSAISASVSAPGIGALVNATVSISGQSSASQTTGTSGTVTFSGLRAGDYTVTAALSSADAQLYDLDTSSVDVSLDVDELEAVAFTATPKTISTISGRLFIDENDKNDMFDVNTEENLTVADIEIVIEGVSVGVFDTIQTDANGEFLVEDLPAANYRVILNTTDDEIPGAVAFGGTNNAPVFTLGVNDAEIVNFPFDIVEQKITVGAFLGVDQSGGAVAPGPRVAPLDEVRITFYPTQQDAVNETNSLGSGETDAETGEVTVDFDREDDTDPLGGDSDLIVFAKIDAADLPSAPLSQNGESIIEIPFLATDSLTIATDEFDFQNTTIVLGFKVQETDGDTYENIRARIEGPFPGVPASPTPGIVERDSDEDGMVYWEVTANDDYTFRTVRRAAGWPNFVVNDDIFDVSLAAPWTFTEILEPADDNGEVDGDVLEYSWDGYTALPGDTIIVGTGNIRWNNVRARGRIHRELNDTLNFQSMTNDGLQGVDNTDIRVERDDDGTWVVASPGAAPPALNGGFARVLPTGMGDGESYRFVANTSNAATDPDDWAVLDDTIVAFAGDGSDQGLDVCPLRAAGSTTYGACSTFALKAQNNMITGTVLYRDGTPVDSGQIQISPAARTIQGRASSVGDTIVDIEAGAFTTNGTVREGDYVLTPVNEEPAAFFAPTTNGAPRTLDVQGFGQMRTPADSSGANFLVTIANAADFHAHRTDATIRGYVVNDRDEDGNTIDVNEALIGATVTLYAADSTMSTTTAADSIVGTATIDANGLYTFEDLVTRRYIVEADAPDSEIVLSDGVLTETQYAVVVDNGDLVVNPAPTAALPFWDFETSMIMNTGEVGEQASYFTFLFTDGTFSGTVINDEDDSDVSSMSIQITRCDAYGAPLPLIPAVGDCTDNGGTAAAGTFQQTLSAADGTYSFGNLREGVYQVVIQSASAGDSDGAFVGANTTGNGAVGENFVFFIDGRTDLEQIEFRVDN